MSPVKRGLYRRFGAVLTALAVSGVLATPAIASSGPSHGRYYDGKPTSTAGGFTSFALDFQASDNGHQLKRLFLKYVNFTCPGGAAASLLVPGNNTAAIAADRRFTITLPSMDSYSPNPPDGSLVLSGHFGGAGTVSGTLVFTGAGQLAGCHKTIGWSGKVRPLVEEFAGHVTEGSDLAPISFYRTIEPHSKVTDFTIGALTVTCPGGGTGQRAFTSVYSLPTHPDATFGGDIFFTDGEAGNITGEFQGAAQAAGTVSYTGRDDCSYSDLIWSAHRVAASVLGPLNFG
jgi:hypothetical protein